MRKSPSRFRAAAHSSNCLRISCGTGLSKYCRTLCLLRIISIISILILFDQVFHYSRRRPSQSNLLTTILIEHNRGCQIDGVFEGHVTVILALQHFDHLAHVVIISHIEAGVLILIIASSLQISIYCEQFLTQLISSKSPLEYFLWLIIAICINSLNKNIYVSV